MNAHASDWERTSQDLAWLAFGIGIIGLEAEVVTSALDDFARAATQGAFPALDREP